MWFKTLAIILLLITFLYPTPEDTITYRRRRGSFTENALLDVQSGAVRTITTDRTTVHNYKAYSVSLIDTLADGERSVIAIYTGNIELHLKFINAWSEKSPNLMCIYENPDTIRLSSDTLVAQNRNRDENVDNVLFSSSIIVTDSVDTMGIATGIDLSYFGGGSGIGGSSIAGISPSDIEWIFGANKYVVICIQNLSGDAAKTTIRIFWCELAH